MLYACTFRAYYFIKGRQGGRARGAILQAGRKYLPINFFNTLQLRPFEKRIKRASDRGGSPIQRNSLRKKNRKYDFESLHLIENRNL